MLERKPIKEGEIKNTTKLYNISTDKGGVENAL